MKRKKENWEKIGEYLQKSHVVFMWKQVPFLEQRDRDEEDKADGWRKQV